MKQSRERNIGVERIIGTILVVLVAVYFKWLFKPAINLRSEGLYSYIMIVGIAAFFIFGIAESWCDSHAVTKISILIAGMAFEEVLA